MTRLALAIALSVPLPFTACGPGQPSAPPYVRVAVSELRMHAEAKRDSRTIQTLKSGRVLEIASDFARGETIDGESGAWIEVKTSDGAQGFVFDTGVRPAMISPPPWETSERDSIPVIDCDETVGDCYSLLEENAIARLGARITPGPDGFEIETGSGDRVTFESNFGVPDDTAIRRYQPLYVFPNDTHVLIAEARHRGRRFLVLDLDSGKRVSLWAPPHGPLGNGLLVVASASSIHNPNGVQIADISGDEPRIVFQRRLDWQPFYSGPGTDDGFDFARFDPPVQGDGVPRGSFIRSRATLARENGKWKFE